MDILLADDHAMVRSGLYRIILDHFPNANVQEVGEACELLGIIKKRPQLDLLILDISLGNENGLDLIPQIKTCLPELPILILSMYDERQYVMRALGLGVAGYLTKDKAPDELFKAMTFAIEGKRYISEGVATQIADFMVNVGHKNTRPHELLSTREYEVFMMIASTSSVNEIAAKLNLSNKTISTYRTRILEKMSLHSNADIISYAFRQGLIR